MTGERYITIENMSAGFALIWGGWIGYPWQAFFDRQPSLYGPMLWMTGGSETAAGAIVFAAGAVALAMQGWKIAQPALMSLTFGFFAALYVFGDASSPAWALWTLLSFCNFLHLYFRVKGWNSR